MSQVVKVVSLSQVTNLVVARERKLVETDRRPLDRRKVEQRLMLSRRQHSDWNSLDSQPIPQLRRMIVGRRTVGRPAAAVVVVVVGRKAMRIRRAKKALRNRATEPELGRLAATGHRSL
jgi:hypothetical protein